MQRRQRPPFPGAPIPRGGASGLQYQRLHALGAVSPVGTPQPMPPPQGRPGPAPLTAAPVTNYQPDQWIGWSEIPAFYTVNVFLGGEQAAQNGGAKGIRPEPFVLKRITWACTGDALVGALGAPLLMNSIDARAVEVSWSDNFTQFFGDEPCLIAAAFGDSNGYLDLPAPILFQGSQSLKVNLRRLFWPYPDETITPQETRFDFNFQGVGLLPPQIGVSGSI